MSGSLLNLIRREVERVLRLQPQPRLGLVADFDPVRYAAKVTLQPEGATTNWLPLLTDWMGNGWGSLAPLTPGDQVLVVFPEFGRNQGVIVGRVYDQRNAPPQKAAQDERWFVHQSGSCLKFLADGSVLLNAETKVRIESTDMELYASHSMSQSIQGYGWRWTWDGGNNFSYSTWQTGANVTNKPHAFNPTDIPEGE